MIDYRNKDVRARVYRERTYLKEFNVKEDWTVDRIMYAHFISLKITDLPNQADCILACYNNAYYIATIILHESFPNAYVSQYMDIALSVPTDNEEYRESPKPSSRNSSMRSARQASPARRSW